MATYEEARLDELRKKKRKTILSKIGRGDKSTKVQDQYLAQYDKEEARIKRIIADKKKKKLASK